MTKTIKQATITLLKQNLKEFLDTSLEEEDMLVEASRRMKDKVEDLKADILKITKFN